MRKISLLLMMLLCCYAIKAQDSRWELNAFVRPNMSDYIHDIYRKRLYNTDWGLETKFHFNNHLRLVSGFGLATRRSENTYLNYTYDPNKGYVIANQYINITSTAFRIPIKLEYMFFPHDKVRFFINTGFISNYLLKQDINSNFIPNGTYTQGKHFGLEEDLVAGAGCEVSLNKKLSIYIEPTYERYLMHFQGFAIIESALYSYGLQTGLSYRF